MRTLGVQHADAMLLRVGADALQEGHIAAGGTVVVALQGGDGVGVGADHGNGPDLGGVKGQNAVVLEQHHGLAGGVQRQGVVLVGVAVGVGDGVVLAVVGEQAQHNAAGEHALAAAGDVLLGHQTLLIGLHHVQVGVAAVHVAAHFEGQGGGFGSGAGHEMPGVEIADGPAVGGHMPLEGPLIAQNIHQQGLGAAGSLAVDAVVRAHDALHLGFLDCRFKGGQVGFLHVLRAGDRVKLMADGFRAGMYREVLGAGSDLQVLAVTLQTLDEPHAQAGGQVGILAVGFMAAAPSGVTEDVDVGAPHGQALVNVPILMGSLAVVLGAGLLADDLGDLLVEVLVKDRRQTDGLGEHSGRTCAGYAMERFIPPVVGRDAQTRNGRGVETQLGGLFLQRHLGNQVMRHPAGFVTV